jgi:two-component system sensor histidine kinase KdpD
LSVAAYDFFFVEPYLTFAVSDSRQLLTFTMLFAVGVVMSTLMRRIRRQERGAVEREQRTATLLAFSRELGRAIDEREAASAIARTLAEVFQRGAAVLLSARDGALLPAAVAGDLVLDAPVLAVARWSFEHAEVAGAGTDTLPGSRVHARPLRSGSRSLGVIVLGAAPRAGFTHEERDPLDAFARQGALALERGRLVEERESASLRARTEELRSTPLSTVSHDLRRPLAAITGAASALRVDFSRREVSVAGREVHLTPIEWKLLSVLARHAGRVLTHRQILREVWGPTHAQQTHTLRVHMAGLRRKIERDPARPEWLLTEPSVGYRLRDRA